MLADSEAQRSQIVEGMKDAGIPIMVYYATPLHMQGAYSYLGYADTDVENALELSRRVFSLPMYPYLNKDEIVGICNRLKSITGK